MKGGVLWHRTGVFVQLYENLEWTSHPLDMAIFKVCSPLFHVYPLSVDPAFEVMWVSTSIYKFLLKRVMFSTKVHFGGNGSWETEQKTLFPAVSDGSRSSRSQLNSPMTIFQLFHLQSTALCPELRTISSFQHPEIKEHREITAESCCCVIYTNTLPALESYPAIQVSTTRTKMNFYGRNYKIPQIINQGVLELHILVDARNSDTN